MLWISQLETILDQGYGVCIDRMIQGNNNLLEIFLNFRGQWPQDPNGWEEMRILFLFPKECVAWPGFPSLISNGWLKPPCAKHCARHWGYSNEQDR